MHSLLLVIQINKAYRFIMIGFNRGLYSDLKENKNKQGERIRI